MRLVPQAFVRASVVVIAVNALAAPAHAQQPIWTDPRCLLDDFAPNAGGWNYLEHVRTFADVNGDGRDDIVGFGRAGVYVAFSTGDDFTEARFLLADFGFDSGWRIDRHIRTMADINGDGYADIVGFGEAGVYVAFSTGEGFTPAGFHIADLGYNSGWRINGDAIDPDSGGGARRGPHHVRIMADVNGDGRADIVAFGNAGVIVALSTGSGFAAPSLWLADFGYDSGWRTGEMYIEPGVGWVYHTHARLLADVNGDGRDDIVGFGNPGTFVALSTGSGFGPAQLWLADYGSSYGYWSEGTRQMADVNGDGRADVVAFMDDGVYVSISHGSGFDPRQRAISGFSPAQGWQAGASLGRHPRLIADVNGDGRADVLGFFEDGTWVSLSAGGAAFGPPSRVSTNFGYQLGWHEGLLRFAPDANGDGKADIVGFYSGCVIGAFTQ